MIRAFVALPLPEPVRQQLNLLSFLLPLPRRVPPENLHLTLAFLGEVPGHRLEDAHFALEGLRAAPFPLTLRGVETFGEAMPRVVFAGVAPSEPLRRLHGKVMTALRAAGLAPDGRRFTPHVTLARLDPARMDAADRSRLSAALIENAGFAAGPFSVAEFALYRSHLGREGPHYEDLARYPLRG
jgi:2'-5' RNA ligase